MNNNIIRTSALIAAAVFALASCLQMEPAYEETVGYLSAPQFDVDVTVENLTSTKAEDYGIVAPEESDIRFIVKDKDSKVVYDQKGLWTSPLVMPVGAYTVEASAGENGFGIPYFTGSATGTVGALDAEVPALSLSLANALVKVSIDENFALHFTGQKILMDEGAYEASFDEWFYVPVGSDLTLTLVGTNSVENTKEFTYTLSSPVAKTAYSVVCKQSSTNWPEISIADVDAANVWATRAYISPATFTNISDDNKNEIVYEAIPEDSSDWSSALTAVTDNASIVFKGLEPGIIYKVRARVGKLISREVSIEPSLDGIAVSAAHSYTNNELDGTDVTMTFAKSDLVKAAISNWSIDICNVDGEVLRSGLTLGTSEGSALTGDKEWPYLPKGTYKLALSVTMTDGEVVKGDLQFNHISDPVFSVIASGYTTYDKYLEHKNGVSGALAAANAAGKAEYIFQISSTVTISENLLKNPNYGTTKVYYTCGPYVEYERDFVNAESDVDEAIKKNNIGDVGGFSWGTNNLTARVVFAGTSISSKSHPCHITGLPYSVSFYDITSAPAGWTTGGSISWSGYGWNAGDSAKYLRLKGAGSYSDRGRVLSPAFTIPDNSEINVTSVVDCFYYASSGSTQNIYVNSNTASCAETTSNATGIKNGTTFNNFNGIGDVTNTMTLSSSKPHISITHNVPKEGAGTRFMGIKSCAINYR